MKSLLIGLALILTSQVSNAFERPFRVDRYYPTVNGYAIAWGIPGKNIDFEKLETLTSDEIGKVLDYSAVRNFIVDVETNEILTTIGSNDEDMVVFNIGDIHFGGHYSLTLNRLAIENLDYDTDAIGVTENYKWSNILSKILLIDIRESKVKTIELDGEYIRNLLQEKLAQSILPKNMELFENGASSVIEHEVKRLNDGTEVNVITFDYCFPKEDRTALEVIATVKMKYENGKVVPYILSVKQKQY